MEIEIIENNAIEVLQKMKNITIAKKDIIELINTFFKKKTNSNTFNIEIMTDFIKAFQNCSSVGVCTILTYYVVYSYRNSDYKNIEKIDEDRLYHESIVKYMIKNTGPIYENANSIFFFLSPNVTTRYSYHNKSNVELFKLIAHLQYNLCPDLLYEPPLEIKTETTKPIKVGFISDLLLTFNSVAKDRLGIIKSLNDDPDFEVSIISEKVEKSYFFNKIISNPINIIVTTNDIIENRKIIANENFDILVYAEIGLCAKSRYTAFSRLAPIQINTWGHSDTSGLPNIDYFVSSKYFNSPEDQEHYSEKLVLFNSLGTYYHDIFKTLDISFNNRIDFCKNVSIATGIDNPTIYGCLQLHFKIHPTFISILNQILMMDKKGVIVILAPVVNTDAEKDFKNNINEQIKYNKRLYFINEMPFNNFIETALCCHVILDYYPFGGFNTTIEMLLNGKICITMPGNLINGKFTKGLYEKMNITEFICTTENEYVTKAVKYGKNILKRKEYENLILKNVHKIIEDEESVQEWKTFLKTIIASHRNK